MRFIQPDMPLVWLTRSRVSPYVWVALLWVLLIAPAIFLVGAHYEEGTTIGLARGAFEDGYWVSPHLYGLRFVERPVLVSWLLGVVGLFTGEFAIWVGRIPAVAALLSGAMLIYWFARRAVGTQGAFFGAACFLLSPMVIQKLITAENDGVVSVLLFAAFVIWWIGSAGGGPSILRWLAIGIVLALAGLVKGPQPLGFFFIGVGFYLLVRSKWRELGGLVAMALIPLVVVVGWYWLVYEPGDLDLWRGQSRLTLPAFGHYLINVIRFAGQLVLELLPGLLLVAPLVMDVRQRRIEANRELTVALLCYAFACTLILTFWPDARTRYAMPMVLAVATLAGIGYHHLLSRLPRLVFTAQVLAGVLLLYVLVLNWVVMPLFPTAFAFAAGEAAPINEAILDRPAPVYVVPFAVSRDILYYLPKPHLASVEELAHAKPPYWAILTPADEALLAAARPDLELDLRVPILKSRARLIDVQNP
jgi:4-amino-4-deoxy-L-arabinose transferase-like glycosyltransferase